MLSVAQILVSGFGKEVWIQCFVCVFVFVVSYDGKGKQEGKRRRRKQPNKFLFISLYRILAVIQTHKVQT